MKTDVIIIGAGMAGLSAALELKKHGISYKILEALDTPGGRAASIKTKDGVAVDLGAHWFHGEDNPLRELLDKYDIEYRADKIKNMWVYKNGKGKKVDPDWLDKLIDWDKATPIMKGEKRDTDVLKLAKNATAREELKKFITMWNGLDTRLKPSAKEFLNDKSVPGGLQVLKGVGVLIDKMIRDVGQKNVIFNQKVSRAKSTVDGIEIKAGRKTYQAKLAIFTGSLGVIKSNIVKFEPALSKGLRAYLSTMAMGVMNKITVEVDPKFFKTMQIEDDMGLELLDGNWPHFCHIKSAGNPLISLFVSGPRAKQIENLSNKQALEYLHKVLKPVPQLLGYERFVKGPAIITKWFGNPFIKGSYSACLPGGIRDWPRKERKVYFAGDSFDKQYPGAMAGAYRSGKAAALMIKESL